MDDLGKEVRLTEYERKLIVQALRSFRDQSDEIGSLGADELIYRLEE